MGNKFNNEQIADMVMKAMQAIFPPKGECEISVDGDADWSENHAKGKISITVTWDTTK